MGGVSLVRDCGEFWSMFMACVCDLDCAIGSCGFVVWTDLVDGVAWFCRLFVFVCFTGFVVLGWM